MTDKTAKLKKLPHIKELDGIRGIAALMVFFHHAGYANLDNKVWPGATGVFVSMCAYGSLGVDLFFVLSGFLITTILLQDQKKTFYYRDFYWKRVLRILPVFLICLFVTLAVMRNIPGFLFCVFFLANFASVFHVSAGGPYWTLAIEEQFYLLWPTVVRRLSAEKVKIFAVAVGLSSVVLRLVFALYGHHNYYLSFLHCDGLAFGGGPGVPLSKTTGKRRPRKK